MTLEAATQASGRFTFAIDAVDPENDNRQGLGVEDGKCSTLKQIPLRFFRLPSVPIATDYQLIPTSFQ